MFLVAVWSRNWYQLFRNIGYAFFIIFTNKFPVLDRKTQGHLQDVCVMTTPFFIHLLLINFKFV